MGSLSKLWAGWKKIVRTFGVFQTRLFLTVFYHTLLLPFGAAVRLFADPLAIKPRPKTTGWVPRTTRDKTVEDMRKQS